MRVLRRTIFWILLIVVFFAWYVLLGPRSHHAGSFFNKEKNAVWLEHEWVQYPKSIEQISTLVQGFSRHGVRFVYVHTGPLEQSGLVDYARISNGADFVRQAKLMNPDIQYLAWLGQLRGKIPYEGATVRSQIARTSAYFVKNLGFDGVHYDIEPVLDSDRDFLLLLDETRAALGKGSTLSVALRELLPSFTGRIISYFYGLDDFNSPHYYQEIADRVDQIVFMTYENTIRKPWLYQYFLKNEVIWTTQLLSGARVIIGLPTYDKPSPTFYPEAENIENGLRGIIDGLNSWRSDKENFDGVALYRYGMTDGAEWRKYEELWGNKFEM